jgi:hypothetical protein
MQFRTATPTNHHPPAQGRLRLTEAQINDIDIKLSSLCAYTEQTGGEARLTIVVKRGKVRFVEMTTSEQVSPAWEGR